MMMMMMMRSYSPPPPHIGRGGEYDRIIIIIIIIGCTTGRQGLGGRVGATAGGRGSWRGSECRGRLSGEQYSGHVRREPCGHCSLVGERGTWARQDSGVRTEVHLRMNGKGG